MMSKTYLIKMNALLCAVLFIIITIVISTICMPIFAYGDNDKIDVTILMYHNIVPNNTRARKYEIRAKDIERDVAYLVKSGYQIVTPSDIMAWQKGKKNIRQKACMLTFDDGYYSYIRYLLPILEKYDIKAVVSVVGEYTKYNKTNPDTTPRYRYLDLEDMKVLKSSGRIEFGLHSYAMHHIKGGYQGIIDHKGEDFGSYKARIEKDTSRLVKVLKKIGITTNIYAYPYGSYSRNSEAVLKGLGMKCTLSCNEGINHLSRNSSLYLLKRYNRDGDISSLSNMRPFKK